MTYPLYLRQRVIKFVKKGNSIVEAGRIFGIHRKTIENWQKADNLTPKTLQKTRKRKLNKELLLKHVKDFPEAILSERAKYFGVVTNAIWYQFKKLGITLKKNDKIQGKKARGTYKIPKNFARTCKEKQQ